MNHDEMTATEHVLASDFEPDTKVEILIALTRADCPSCAEQADEALGQFFPGVWVAEGRGGW